MRHPKKSWPVLAIVVIGLFMLCDGSLSRNAILIRGVVAFICSCFLIGWEVVPEIKEGQEYRREHPKRSDLHIQKWQPYHRSSDPSKRSN